MVNPRPKDLVSAHDDDNLRELARLLAMAYLRLLTAKAVSQDGQNRLDSLGEQSDELAMTNTRRRRRG